MTFWLYYFVSLVKKIIRKGMIRGKIIPILFQVVFGSTLSFAQDDVPFRKEDTYEIRLDYNFKARPIPEKDLIDFRSNGAFTDAGLLPHLTVNVHMLSLSSEDDKVRITGNLGNNASSYKLKENKQIVIVMGFTEDMKEKLTSHQYTLTFLAKKRKKLNKITLEVLEDGTFLVNGVENGRL